ncbi:type VII toxin-antitoxin system HepT family RNase toxin [Microbulbifer harenosus]|uniref:DUF86 domain-containing protein n=1 Tax=Microbulbifer harenosus TaxID=2576840 RepID=A0ABY2UH23_9GAMM|nr:DUF86 domain-containing protein [Microbulbifer harenosus]TLM76969.1 DUF86 domain-containing protein [Microbulbifer harenosus]
MNYQAYCDAINEQVDIHSRLLKQISEKQTLGLLERTAAERSLQILVEAAIGAAKHTSRKLKLPERTEAASSIIQLLENQPLDDVTPQEMKGAVGMRNAIVHDYLNLDWELIQEVITEKKYLKLGQFVRHCSELLLRD